MVTQERLPLPVPASLATDTERPAELSQNPSLGPEGETGAENLSQIQVLLLVTEPAADICIEQYPSFFCRVKYLKHYMTVIVVVPLLQSQCSDFTGCNAMLIEIILNQIANMAAENG